MKLKQLLNEKVVNSSWLRDVSYIGRHNKLFPNEELITFKVQGNNKTYIVRGCTRSDFIQWIKSTSKGKFYHYLKHKFARGWYDTNPFRITSRAKITPRNKETW